MVRGRRVRAVVPCSRGDGCCSPKRKDQRLDFAGKLTQNAVTTPKSQTITHFFKVVEEETEKAQITENAAIFTSNTDVCIISLHQDSLQINGDKMMNLVETPDKKKAEEEEITIPSPSTPHRIELCSETGSSTTSALSQLRIAPTNKLVANNAKSRKKLQQNQIVNKQLQTSTAIKEKPQTKLTEFFPIRRSVRKTSKKVLEEQQRTIEQCIRNEVDDGLEIHNFEGKGRGIVTARTFTKGEFVIEYAGELIDMVEAKRREKSYSKDQNTGCYMYYFKYKNQQYCVDATAESGKLGRLVNHSRNGNLITRTLSVDNVPRLILVAKDDIEAGVEVTYDYGDRSKESLVNHPWLAL